MQDYKSLRVAVAINEIYDIYYIIRQKASVWKASVKFSIKFLPLVHMTCSLCISLCHRQSHRERN